MTHESQTPAVVGHAEPTVRLLPHEQLRKFCEWERVHNPHPDGKPHVAEWAMGEIDQLREQRGNLVLFCGRLIRRLRAAREGAGIAAGDDALENEVIGYLRRNGLHSPLRADESNPAVDEKA